MSITRYLVGTRAFHKSWPSVLRLFSICNYTTDINFEDIPDVTPVSIKRILKQNDIVFEEGYTCFITNCLLCGKQMKPTSPTNNFYINKTTGI